MLVSGNIYMKLGEKGYSNIISFEDKLILNTSIVITIASFIFTIVNIFIGFEKELTYVTSLASIIYLLLFILGFYLKKIGTVRRFIPIISGILINIVWYYNYVSNGPALVLFVLYYCFILLIGTRKQIIVYSIAITINLIGLFLFEYKNYTILPSYESEHARIIDVYIVTFISLIIGFSFIFYAKRSYLEQYVLAKKADELKTSFLANMSHEIRTPLNAIVGFSSLLANRDYDQEKKEKYRAYISSNSEYLLHLVNDILDLSRIESNQLDLLIEGFNVSSLFEQLEEEYTRMLQKLGKESVQLKYIATTEKIEVKADRFRFEQVIRNFLSNAIKFTDEGYIKFGIVPGDKEFVFYVKDTGKGISQEEIKLIFSRFTKLNKNEDVLHRGVGLGLFLSKQLAHLMGGEIWAESEPGKGSTFYFSFPQKK